MLLVPCSRRVALRWALRAPVALALSACTVGPSQKTTAPQPSPMPISTAIASPVTTPSANGAAEATGSPSAATPGATAAPAVTGTPAAGTLRFTATGSTDDIATLQRLTDAFIQKNADVPVRFEPVTAEYAKQTEAALSAGGAPDIVMVDWQQFGSCQKRGLLADLTGPLGSVKADTAGWYAVLHDFFGVGTTMLGVPLTYSPRVLYVNKAMLEAAGQPFPDVAWTWERFTTATRALVKGDASAPSHVGLYPSTDPLDWISFVLAAGGDVFDHPLDPTQCVLDTPYAADGLQNYADLWLKHQGAANPTTSPSGTPLKAFMDGTAAMAVGPRDWVAMLKGVDRFAWDVSFLPAGPAGHAAPLVVTGLSVPKDSRLVANAAKLLSFLSATKESQIEIGKSGSQVPALRVAATAADAHPDQPRINYKVFTEALNFAAGPYRSPSWADVTAQWSSDLDGVWKGSTTAADALKSSAPKVTELLRKGLGITPTPQPGAFGTPGSATPRATR